VSRIELFAAVHRFPPPLRGSGFPDLAISSPRWGEEKEEERRERERTGTVINRKLHKLVAPEDGSDGVMSYAAGNNIIIGPCELQRDVFSLFRRIFRAQLLVSALDLCRRPFFAATPDADGFQYRCPRGRQGSWLGCIEVIAIRDAITESVRERVLPSSLDRLLIQVDQSAIFL